jgi:hypothetical protein
MVADIITEPTFTASAPRMLFKAPLRIMVSDPIRSYDITPDGRRFLVVEWSGVKPVEVKRLNLIQNWFEELKRLVPTGKK